jgi:hypothetical protein
LDQFFVSRAFQRNNASIGVVIRFPFFNAPQRAHAAVADGDAVKARAEVQNAKNQVSQEVLKLQGSARQLAAAKEVSQLEYDLAQSNFNEIEVRTTSGGATIHDRANASAEISEKFNQLQDADFELSRARLALLRMTGSWHPGLGCPSSSPRRWDFSPVHCIQTPFRASRLVPKSTSSTLREGRRSILLFGIDQRITLREGCARSNVRINTSHLCP